MVDIQGMSFVDLLGQYPIFESVSREFLLRDYFAMSFVSTRVRDLVVPWLPRGLDVDSSLKQFFEKTGVFREHLRELPGVIVGDFAFRHFVGQSREPNRMDVVLLDGPYGVYGPDVPEDYDCRSSEIVAFLEQEGYEDIIDNAQFGDNMWVCCQLSFDVFDVCMLMLYSSMFGIVRAGIERYIFTSSRSLNGRI